MSKIFNNAPFLMTSNNNSLDIDILKKSMNDNYQKALQVINHFGNKNNLKSIRQNLNSKKQNRRHSCYLQEKYSHKQKQQQEQQQQQLQHNYKNLLSKNKIVVGSREGGGGGIDDTTKIIANNNTTLLSTSSLSAIKEIKTTKLTTTKKDIDDLYFWYGDSLACSGRLYEAFDIYAHIANQLGDIIPIERLKYLTTSLINNFSVNKNKNINRNFCNCGDYHNFIPSIMANSICNLNLISSAQQSVNNNNNNNAMLYQQCVLNQNLMDYEMHNQLQRNMQQSQQKLQYPKNEYSKFQLDPLLCPFCEDVIMCPVTSPCGHTFCSQCCSNASQCKICGFKLNSNSIQNQNNIENLHSNETIINLKQDVLVKRLIDKWWPQELEARKLNEEAAQYLDMNSLDEALKYCNESLEKSPNNYKSLILRSEVLYRLNHFQSSLADADNALKNHPTSSKAHHRRALALIGLGRNEEALISQCLAISFDKNSTCTSTSIFKNEVCRLLQRFLLPTTKEHNPTKISSSPYIAAMKKRRKNRHKLIQISQNPGTSDCDEANSSCGEDDNFVHENRRRYTRRSVSLSTESFTIPRSSMRLRTLLDRIQQEIQKLKRMENKPNILQLNVNQIDVSDFDCVLCCRTLWKPVVTPCGHTYCWVCLDRCMDYSSSCPLCMSPLVEQPMYRQSYRGGSSTPIPFSLAKKSVTKFLEVAMQRFIPDWYEKRRRQEIESEPSVPVFICTTAFPNVPCPLFVYEPRYRLMVRRAIESGERQFGIVQPHTGKSRYSDIGTMLDIRDCVLLGDGCSILSTIGCRRFKILSRDEKDGYETAKVEYIYDETISDDFIPVINEMHSAVLFKARKWFESLSRDIKEEILRSFGPMPALEDNWERIADGPAWAWWIIAILPLNQQLKVNILATTSLEKRLRAIGKTLDYITGRVRKSTQQNCVVVQCEGLPSCQAIDCCQQTTQSSTQSDENNAEVNSQTEYML